MLAKGPGRGIPKARLDHRGKVMTRREFHGFPTSGTSGSRRRSGAAIPEYVILLALVVSVAAIGLSALGSRTQETLGRLADSGSPQRGRATPNSARAAANFGSPEAQEPDTLVSSAGASRLFLGIALAGIAVALAGTLLERRGRQRASLPQEKPAEADVPPEALPPAFQDKRWWLWHTLVNGSEMVLQNRVEVRHLMTGTPKTVSCQATVAAMHELMQQHRLRHLLVCEKGERLVGVISDRDLRRSAATKTAAEIMTANPRTVTPATPINVAIAWMLDDSISCLPVVDEGRLCGLLTTTDLVLTLQCLLQLWLRLRPTIEDSPEWGKHMDAIAAALDRPASVA